MFSSPLAANELLGFTRGGGSGCTLPACHCERSEAISLLPGDCHPRQNPWQVSVCGLLTTNNRCVFPRRSEPRDPRCTEEQGLSASCTWLLRVLSRGPLDCARGGSEVECPPTCHCGRSEAISLLPGDCHPDPIPGSQGSLGSARGLLPVITQIQRRIASPLHALVLKNPCGEKLIQVALARPFC